MDPVTRRMHLVDTSVLIRLPHPQMADRIGPLVEDGLVATCAVITLRLLEVVRDTSLLERVAKLHRQAFVWLPTTDQDHRRAIDTQRQLLGTRLRAGWPCLLVAAVAERYRVTVLHADADFDQVAKVTGQPVEWVVPDDQR